MVTLGLAPLAGKVSSPLRFARRAGRALFDFEGLRSFKAKLHPARWDRVFLSFPPDVTKPRALADALTAFAPRRLLRFGVRTLLRGPTIVVRLLALLLVPWTMLLASADARICFPTPLSSGHGWPSILVSSSGSALCNTVGATRWRARSRPRWEQTSR